MSSIDKAIGVFDSGLGGISVLKELRSLMPQEDYLYYGASHPVSRSSDCRNGTGIKARCRWQTSAACSCTRNTVYTEGKKV